MNWASWLRRTVSTWRFMPHRGSTPCFRPTLRSNHAPKPVLFMGYFSFLGRKEKSWKSKGRRRPQCQRFTPKERSPYQRVINHHSGQIITTSAEVTLNGGLVREPPQSPRNSGLGIILICPDHCPFIIASWPWPCFKRGCQTKVNSHLLHKRRTYWIACNWKEECQAKHINLAILLVTFLGRLGDLQLEDFWRSRLESPNQNILLLWSVVVIHVCWVHLGTVCFEI